MTVPPEVHTSGVVVENVTVNPDDAVAVTANGACPNVLPVSALKVMVWSPFATVKLC